jgi:ATP-dependent Lon protease
MKKSQSKNTGIYKFQKINFFDEFEGKSSKSVDIDIENVPILPMQNNVSFPNLFQPVTLTREASMLLCEEAHANGEAIIIVTQKKPDAESPGKRDLYTVGVLAQVIDIIHLPDGTTTAMIKTGLRARLDAIKTRKPYLRGSITICDEILNEDDNAPLSVTLTLLDKKFRQMLDLLDEKETLEMRNNLDQLSSLNPLDAANFIATNAPIDVANKQLVLEQDNALERYSMLLTNLSQAFEFMKMRDEIQRRTGMTMNQQQREHFLQQQIRTIQDELGYSIEDQDISQLEKEAEKMVWSEEAKQHFGKELKKLERYNVQNPEYSVQYGYLETLLSLPWDKHEDKEINVADVERVLDEDHYGLEDVKERILEQVSVMKLRNDMKAPILCLYGPPGVGKTSLGKSIARALNREYARISLGGLHDEAEIRGHRRTYIGAMPGRIITALKKCQSNDPVFVLDEIDKIGKDFKGDPSTAMLEVLDPEQNNKFHDNYVDFDYDLSKIMFIATANDISTISRPLLDRMEMIEISGYVPDEKIEIAIKHLIPKVLEEIGFEKDEITFEREAVAKIIESYTRESGVRLLEKKIAKVVRKLGVKKARGEEYPTTLSVDDVVKLLGAEEVNPDMYETNKYIGVVTGLAWTQVGGEILFIETSLTKGKGEKLTLTGNLGDVMKESAVISLQYLKAHASEIGIDTAMFEQNDVHVHVPEGAIPKDGPSAGITMTTALASSFTGRKVRSRLAMTGEMTLRGKVLPVGGIKEKILAAKRAGITDIILCKENRKDIEKIPEKYLEGLTFHYVEDIAQVLDFALLPKE